MTTIAKFDIVKPRLCAFLVYSTYVLPKPKSFKVALKILEWKQPFEHGFQSWELVYVN